MKSLTFVLVLLLTTSTAAYSQTDFVIGAEWLNNPASLKTDTPHVPADTHWAKMAELGLKWWVTTFPSSAGNSNAFSALSLAQSHDMKLMIQRYLGLHPAAKGQRWQLHPEYLRSDNGPEFIAEFVREWLHKVGTKTLFIEPGSPWENGYIESFNGKLRDELLNGEIFDTVTEAKVITERWRNHYNKIRPHSSLGYRPPAPEAYAFLQVANA